MITTFLSMLQCSTTRFCLALISCAFIKHFSGKRAAQILLFIEIILQSKGIKPVCLIQFVCGFQFCKCVADEEGRVGS